MTAHADLEARLNRLIEEHVATGVVPSIDQAVADRPDFEVPLRALFARYLSLNQALDDGLSTRPGGSPDAVAVPPPVIPGFRTIERLGAGGMGEVYKLQDLQLDRIVAGKVLRRDRASGARLADYLREAKALALVADPRIVQVFDLKADADPPVIIMEFVEGFELGRIGPSLEVRQRARVIREVCDAIGRAHAAGIQHRDLKPSNIMLDGRLAVKILDFGLSAGDPRSGHFQGTPQYIAPEQLDTARAIDARTDVYAMGVILYELLCGVPPYAGSTTDILRAIQAGQPRLPVEIRPGVPEPLQAIALKAMERDPARRYQSTLEMQEDLDRYLDGRPVLARPTQYATTLAARVRPHVDQIGEWLRLRLIYPHEAARLTSAYAQLEAREDDWIVASRTLSYSQIALYLGAFVLFAGSLFYFAAHRFYASVTGIVPPFIVLGLPFVGLNAAGRWLYGRNHQAVAVAFFLAGVSLLPLFLLIFLAQAHLWVVSPDTPGQLFSDGSISNRQLQVTILLAAIWAGWLALRTTTAALSTVFAVLAGLFAIALLADFGLRDWIDEGRFDALALHLSPMIAVYGVAGWLAERRQRPWFAGPLYLGGALTAIAVLDLLALNGKLAHLVGVSLQSLQPATVSNGVLIDTLTALTLNGIAFYLIGLAIERRGTAAMTPASVVLFTIAPFSMLEPLAYLSETKEYWPRLDWLYLTLAAGIAILSHQRQRRSFYYAGLINAGLALYLIADRRQWFDRPSWAVAVIVAGLAALVAGFLLDTARRKNA